MLNYRDLRIGETRQASNGQMMTIIDYKNIDDVTIQFEDGTIVYKQRYTHYLKGYIKNPNYSRAYKYRVGETKKNNLGHTMTIIEYNNADDMTVRFEDGVEIKTKYASFRLGNTQHPDDRFKRSSTATIEHRKQERLNEQSRAKCGLMMTVIAYRGRQDIDIRFEDGVEVYHKSYTNFKRGKIGHPKHKTPNNNGQPASYRLGEKVMTKYGMTAEISKYINSKNFIVQFEDGVTVKCSSYRSFLRGGTTHPFPITLNGIEIDNLAYVYKDVGNFYCRCKKCGKKDILTLEEVKSHHC